MNDPCADEKASGESSRGIRFIHRSSESRSYTFEVIHATANKFFREFEYEQALRCYNKAVEKNVRQYAKVFRNRGLCSTRLSLHVQAVADYEKSLELEPSSVRGRYFLGRQYLEVGRLEESEKQLKEALKYGEEQNMINDEKIQIIKMINRNRERKREMELEKERVRLQNLLAYLKDLIFEDTKKKISRIKEDEEEDAEEKIEKIELNLNEYLEELKTAFATASVPLKPASIHPVPDYLRDGISLGIMKEPVITPSGISYENSLIRLHLRTDPRDPSSRLELNADQLRPNKALKDVIKDYMKRNRLTYDDL